MLDEEVHQRNQCSKEGTRQVLSVLDSLWIWWTQCQTTQCPWQCSHQIADHEDVVPIVVVCARHVCPSSASQGSKNSHSSHKLGQRAVWPIGQTVPQEDKRKSRTRAYGDEDLKYGAFGVAVANGCAHRGEPFNWVAKVLVLHDFVIMQRHSNDKRAEKGAICGKGVQVRDVVSRNLQEGSVRAGAAEDIVIAVAYHGDNIAIARFGRHRGWPLPATDGARE